MTEIDVEDLILELKELKLRVARLEHNNRANTDTTSAPDSTLSVGDRVRIKNNTGQQTNTGQILRKGLPQ
jgi:hypothetical protein